MHAKSLSPVWLFVTLWTVARQAPLSTGFSRQEYWSGLPSPPPGDLMDPGIEPSSFTSPALAGRFFFFTTSACWEVKSLSYFQLFATPWTVAYQAPPSMGFSRQKYWSGLPFPSPGLQSKKPEIASIRVLSISIGSVLSDTLITHLQD